MSYFTLETRFSPLCIGWPDWAGVLHGYEIELMFGIPLIYRQVNQPDPYDNTDRSYAALMLRYWLNFIHAGDPNIDFMTKTDVNRYVNNKNGLEFLSYKLPNWMASHVNNAVHLYISDMGTLRKKS